MRNMVDKLLKQYGMEMTLSREEMEKQVWGFFQTVQSRSFQNMVRRDSPFGTVSRGQYVYIGSAGETLNEGDTLTVAGREYVVQRWEPYYYAGEAVYIWGLCCQKGGGDTWGT